jgi:adenine C2-methylase RlmN of 23S rRNA A2503 and tRNA A37
MNTLYSQETQAFKFTHEDGSETSVKLSPSGSFDSNNLDRKNPIVEDKEKYSIIISCSKGCQMECNFCHLTKLKMKFEPLTEKQIFDNVMSSIREVYKSRPDIAGKYIKLCWMGMGEAILQPEVVRTVSILVLNTVLEGGLAIGVDGVDISTVLPKTTGKWRESFDDLDTRLSNYPLNPSNNVGGRSPLRLFYSLHHYDESERNKIIPNTRNIDSALKIITEFRNTTSINVVLHYMFMEGVNDSEEDVVGLVNWFNSNDDYYDTQFRVLRYNSFNTVDAESCKMNLIVKYLEDYMKVKQLKIQYSSGEDISSACGQFIGG